MIDPNDALDVQIVRRIRVAGILTDGVEYNYLSGIQKISPPSVTDTTVVLKFEIPEPVLVVNEDSFDVDGAPVGKSITLAIVLSSKVEAKRQIIEVHNRIEDILRNWDPRVRLDENRRDTDEDTGIDSIRLVGHLPLTDTEDEEELPYLAVLSYNVMADIDYQPITHESPG